MGKVFDLVPTLRRGNIYLLHRKRKEVVGTQSANQSVGTIEKYLLKHLNGARKLIMQASNIKYYVTDTFLLLKEKARDAKRRQDNTIGTPDAPYYMGYLMAFHNVISLLQSQAVAFDIPLSELGLDDLEPEQELL